MPQKLRFLGELFVSKLKDQPSYKEDIYPVILENTDLEGKVNQDASTLDHWFLRSVDEVINLSHQDRKLPLTDYAIANGAYIGSVDELNAYCFLRCANHKNQILSKHDSVPVINDGIITEEKYFSNYHCTAPSAYLDINSILYQQSKFKNFGKIHTVNKNGNTYHTIEYGTFPKMRAENSQELENALTHGQVKPTGKKYLGALQDNGVFAENLEYKYHGKLYVRVKVAQGTNLNQRHFNDKTTVVENEYVWIKVEPLTLKIMNWDEMPKLINPDGNGRAFYMDVWTEYALVGGIPFHAASYENTNNALWEYSPLRTYLNSRFMYEAFNISPEIIKANGRINNKPPIMQALMKQQDNLEMGI